MMLYNRNDRWLALSQGANEFSAAGVTWKGDKPTIDMFLMRSGELWFADTLKELNADLKQGRRMTTTLLQAENYQLLPLEAPNVPHKEMLESVRWQIRDQLLFSAEDACLDIMRIPRGLQDQGRSVYVVAAAGELIRQRTQLLEQAGFYLAVVDIPEMGQRNLAALFEQGGEGLAMLSANGGDYLLTISLAGALCMTRRISAGTAARQGDWSSLAREIDRSLKYFTRHFGKPVSRLISAVVEQGGFDDSLTAQLEVPVEALNLAEVIDIASAPELADAAIARQALPVIGAALRRDTA